MPPPRHFLCRLTVTRPYLPNYAKQAGEGALLGKTGRVAVIAIIPSSRRHRRQAQTFSYSRTASAARRRITPAACHKSGVLFRGASGRAMSPLQRYGRSMRREMPAVRPRHQAAHDAAQREHRDIFLAIRARAEDFPGRQERAFDGGADALAEVDAGEAGGIADQKAIVALDVALIGEQIIRVAGLVKICGGGGVEPLFAHKIVQETRK